MLAAVRIESVPRSLAWLWLVGGLITGVGALVGVVAGWIFVGAMGSAVTDTVTISRRVLTTVGDTTTVIDGVFGDVAASLRDVQITLADTSLTLTRASVITRNLGGVVAEDVPESVDAIRATIPALIDTARVIDTTMRGLSFFGVDYDPEVPLDESLRVIETQLGEIPTLLRAQQDTLSEVAGDLGVFSSSTLEISDDLAAIRVRLADASTVLDGYGTIVADSAGLLDELESRVAGGVGLIRALLVFVGLGAAATQTMPIVAGMSVLRQSSEVTRDR